MRRFGPEVVDLAFKMRCFGAFGPQNTKNLCFYLPKQRKVHHASLRSLWDAADDYGWWWQEQEQVQYWQEEGEEGQTQKHR